MLCLAALAFAGVEEDAARASLAAAFPKLPIASVTKSDIDGVYQVITEDNVLYYAPKAERIIFGEIWTKEGKSLTAEIRNNLLAQKGKSLVAAKSKAVKIGNGKHTVIEVTDPDCPYCRKMHTYWSSRNDVTRYVFFMPMSFHPQAELKSRYIMAATDKAKALDDVYSGKIDKRDDLLAREYDDKGAVADMVQLAQQAGVKGTPAFWIDGEFVSGADIAKIEGLIGAAANQK